MKKLFFILLIAVTFSSFGQDSKSDSSKEPYFGVKAGLNLINSSNYDGGHHLNFGYQIGGTFTIPMSSKFSFQPEMLIQSIGTTTKYTNVYSNGTTSEEYKYRNVYLQIPLDFKYAITNYGDIEFGPNVSIALSGKKVFHAEYNLDGTLTTYDNSYNNTSNLKKIGFGFNIGTNYAISSNVYTGLRYTLMIGNDIKKTMDNSIIAFSVGYNFK
jgi:hypothetical protein